MALVSNRKYPLYLGDAGVRTIIKAAKNGLPIEGNVDISSSKIPDGDLSMFENVTINGYFRCVENKTLKRLPANWVIKSYCIISDCDYLTEFPAGWEIGWYLLLSDNKNLRRLPEKIVVEDSFSVSRCTELVNMPAELHCKMLSIKYCSKITKLPPTISTDCKVMLLGGSGVASDDPSITLATFYDCDVSWDVKKSFL